LKKIDVLKKPEPKLKEEINKPELPDPEPISDIEEDEVVVKKEEEPKLKLPKKEEIPITYIDPIENIKNAFIILDSTWSMKNKTKQLIQEVNNLRKGGLVPVSICYELSAPTIMNKQKTIKHLIQLNKEKVMTKEDFTPIGSTVYFKDCLQTSSEKSYDLIYLIGDGDFDNTIETPQEFNVFFADKNKDALKRAILFYEGNDMSKAPKWKNIVEGSGFTLKPIQEKPKNSFPGIVKKKVINPIKIKEI